ncbi:hypothetical protein [uncultured Umboniibacter sp.]|uniref:hypothetical protein n=1 Tax=uncultured Umboniibacter sp. TaxID=1798917 RepID=UPI002633B476|nr:hypothetical protein [uncultured Umboniibacter sp.]
MKLKFTAKIISLVFLFVSAGSNACNISFEGGQNQHLGDYRPNTGSSSNLNMRVSCANNKAITLSFHSNNNCQLRRRQSVIPYDIYVNSGAQNYCNRRAFSGGFSQYYLVTIFAFPVSTSLESGRYSDNIEIELTF